MLKRLSLLSPQRQPSSSLCKYIRYRIIAFSSLFHPQIACLEMVQDVEISSAISVTFETMEPHSAATTGSASTSPPPWHTRVGPGPLMAGFFFHGGDMETIVSTSIIPLTILIYMKVRRCSVSASKAKL